MKKTAVVILNWNGAKMLLRFLPMVIEHSRDEAEVYVADNASTDDSMEVLRTRFPEVRTIVLERNWGFAEGYNKALEQIDAEYYVLLNSDVEVTPHWLTPLTDFMDAHPNAAACQPKLLAENDKNSFEYAGACGGFIDRYGYPYCRGRIMNAVERDEGQYNTETEILWATGACMVVRSACFKQAGGFDGRFFAHNEEIDLCWRLRLMGKSIHCVPESHVYHIGGGTLPKNNPMKTYLNFRNNLTMLYKNLSEEELHPVMRARLFLDYIAALQALITGRFGDFKAIVRGRRAFKQWLPEYREVRKEIQTNRKIAHVVGISHHSILWQYYIKGVRKYSELKAE